MNLTDTIFNDSLNITQKADIIREVNSQMVTSDISFLLLLITVLIGVFWGIKGGRINKRSLQTFMILIVVLVVLSIVYFYTKPYLVAFLN